MITRPQRVPIWPLQPPPTPSADVRGVFDDTKTLEGLGGRRVGVVIAADCTEGRLGVLDLVGVPEGNDVTAVTLPFPLEVGVIRLGAKCRTPWFRVHDHSIDERGGPVPDEVGLDAQPAADLAVVLGSPTASMRSGRDKQTADTKPSVSSSAPTGQSPRRERSAPTTRPPAPVPSAKSASSRER